MRFKLFNSLPFTFQHDTMDCGPACLAMISRYYGKKYSLQFLRENSFLTKDGVSLLGITNAAQTIGIEALAFRGTVRDLIEENSLPCILFWREYHFVVLYKISKNTKGKYFFIIADPSVGIRKLDEFEFKNSWLNNKGEGVVLLLEPSDKFRDLYPEHNEKNNIWKYIRKYIFNFKREFLILILCLLVGSLISLSLPFLTQIIIDNGINNKDIGIVLMVLFAQFFIFSGTIVIDVVRNWLVLFIGARININILTDYLSKLIKLPLKFFETKFLNDFYQRILDHSRIEVFLTSQGLMTFFSLLNLSIFLFVLLKYNFSVFGIYILFTSIAILWSLLYMKKRERLDYIRFRNNTMNQESIDELINGIQEIKLNNFEDYKINKWKNIQIQTFKNNQSILKLTQIQSIGFDYINQIKNILVSFFSAKLVIENTLTLGEMMSISFIIGQLNSPINQLIEFIKSFQDAKLSFYRLIEVQENQNEEIDSHEVLKTQTQKGIFLRNVSFQYEDPLSPLVLKNINLHIPKGKTTAIVGESGCGKTTLLKLILKFYKPTHGSVHISDQNLENLSPSDWRRNCGVVMQDTYIFSESIARNIAMSDLNIDEEKLQYALKKSNIEEFVSSLALKHHTLIGSLGNGLSNGQRQRLLIARTVYKNPDYIFFDEATSSLDSNNERIIYDNINEIFKGKTMIIIAHRLSTVKNADKIVVLDYGEIAECGTHLELLSLKGIYYNLVKNQLDNE